MNLLPGIPPSGLGVYVWQSSGIPSGPWDFFAVDLSLGETRIAEARARGPVWLFDGPSSWTPSTWRATLARHMARVAAGGVEGIIANPEESWRSASESELREFGAALREAAKLTRIGVVTIPTQMRVGTSAVDGFELVAREAGPAVWWSVELYAHGTPPSEFASWVAAWERIAPRRVTVTVAGFIPNTDLARANLGTEAAYRAYLDAMPNVAAAIVWPNASTLASRGYMLRALSDRYSSPFARVAMAARALSGFAVLSTVGAVLLTLCLALVALTVI